ncbi:MAG: hypothetical protein P4L53_26570 [Candidatus Obscuribacterales bacterium]|nr:hypothetical protein [Candidatus Obscuribacterales bacterium]
MSFESNPHSSDFRIADSSKPSLNFSDSENHSVGSLSVDMSDPKTTAVLRADSNGTKKDSESLTGHLYQAAGEAWNFVKEHKLETASLVGAAVLGGRSQLLKMGDRFLVAEVEKLIDRSSIVSMVKDGKLGFHNRGTGFIIAREGNELTIASAEHVLKSGDKKVRLADGAILSISDTEAHPYVDAAITRVVLPPDFKFAPKPLEMGDAPEPFKALDGKSGEGVFAVSGFYKKLGARGGSVVPEDYEPVRTVGDRLKALPLYHLSPFIKFVMKNKMIEESSIGSPDYFNALAPGTRGGFSGGPLISQTDGKALGITESANPFFKSEPSRFTKISSVRDLLQLSARSKAGDILPIEEAAKRLNVEASKLDDLAKEGKIDSIRKPAEKSGWTRHVLFDAEAQEKFRQNGL